MQLNDAADQSAEDFLNSPRLGGRSPEGCAGNDLSEPAIGRRLSKVVSSPSLKDAPTPMVACPQPHGEDSCDWSFDDDDRGAFLPPVKNQGQCGSCYAFSSVAALEAALAIVEHKNSGKHTPVSLSEQMVITTPWAATGPSAVSPQGPPRVAPPWRHRRRALLPFLWEPCRASLRWAGPRSRAPGGTSQTCLTGWWQRGLHDRRPGSARPPTLPTPDTRNPLRGPPRHAPARLNVERPGVAAHPLSAGPRRPPGRSPPSPPPYGGRASAIRTSSRTCAWSTRP